MTNSSRMPRALFLFFAVVLFPCEGRPQVVDDFSDGDWTHDPSWSGEAEAWVVAPLDGNLALRINGLATADTLQLTIPSSVSSGLWSFTVAHRDVNLSTFNGVRVFLMVDTPDLTRASNGYFVQLGTSNADDVRLYRLDGDARLASNRVLVGSSSDALLAGLDGTYVLEVSRTGGGTWTLRVDGREAFTVDDATYGTSRFFGLWAKHSRTAPRHVFFDDIRVTGTAGPIPDPDPPSPPLPPPAPGDLVVNEINYAPPDPALEFVELYNRTDRPVDLTRLLLADERGLAVPLSDAPGTLPPHGYVVAARDASALRAVYPGVDALDVPGWPTLNNGGDTVALHFEDLLIDSVPYAPAWGGSGVSLERRDPAGPSWSPTNFGSSVAPEGATPGRSNSLFAPDREPPTLRFVEQTDPTTLAVYLNEPLAEDRLRPDRFHLADGRRPARLTVGDDGLLLTLHFSGTISGATLTARDLADYSGNEAPTRSYPMAYQAEPGDLIVNEILFAPRADAFDGRPDQPEYVELYNRAERLLTLREYYWTGRPDEANRADTLRFGTSLVAVPPGGYAVVFADPTPGADLRRASSLSRAFLSLQKADPGVTLLAIIRSSLGLRNDGDLVRLHRPDGASLDAVPYDPSWHHPSLVESYGVALERIHPFGPSDDARSWTSAVDPEGGTPGRPNSVRLLPASPPVISGVTVSPSPFSPDGDGVDDHAAISYTLPSATALLRVHVFDSRGRPVRHLEEAAPASSTGVIVWDGLDDEGRNLRTGIYVLWVEAVDARDGTVQVFRSPVVLVRPHG